MEKLCERCKENLDNLKQKDELKLEIDKTVKEIENENYKISVGSFYGKDHDITEGFQALIMKNGKAFIMHLTEPTYSNIMKMFNENKYKLI